MDMINQDIKNSSFLFSMQKTKPKMLKNKKHQEFFFEILVDSMYAKNNKTRFFFFFGGGLLKPKKNKNTSGKPKKKSFESKPNILLNVLFFVFLVSQAPQDFWLCFFGFSKVFAVLVILDIYILYKISEALMLT